jgi:hypothetical protein
MEQQKKKDLVFCFHWNIHRPPAGRNKRETREGGAEEISTTVKKRGFLNFFLFRGFCADRLYGFM